MLSLFGDKIVFMEGIRLFDTQGERSSLTAGGTFVPPKRENDYAYKQVLELSEESRISSMIKREQLFAQAGQECLNEREKRSAEETQEAPVPRKVASTSKETKPAYTLATVEA
ncbi:hypothetical protein KC669_01490 [Candidatus Dojkabacteria bacterium]|uniref:Uncharacterized protein n=1 Tax=Candidatus Dojkabacteria bacterium TaxID=2099670 RepID=A0A955L9M6_9BACT|nr:hypothetical protein [Candidatus Dojkabacteria bacterium]